MSGGHFDYYQHHINEIADKLERDIADIEYGRNIGTVKKKNVCAHLIDNSGRKEWPNWLMHKCSLYDNSKDLIESLKEDEYFFEEDGRYFIYDYRGSYEMIISDCESEEYADGKWHREVNDLEVLEELKKGLKIIKTAAIYAQRIDWLLSDDDGEESFKRRLKEELEELDSKPLIDYEYWNSIIEENIYENEY